MATRLLPWPLPKAVNQLLEPKSGLGQEDPPRLSFVEQGFSDLGKS